MMKVLYDSDVFSNQTFGGISRYFVELMNNLPQEWTPELSLWASENEYLSLLNHPKRYILLRHFPEHRKLYRAINGISDRRLLKKGDYDIFHTTGFNPYFIDRVRTPYVATVHDMIYLDNYRAGTLKKEIVDGIEKVIFNADRIIAISESTRRGLLEAYPQINPDRVDVVHHGFAPPCVDLSAPTWLPRNYLLFVGQRGDYKNFDNFFKAYTILARRDETLRLLCTGRPFNRGERDMIARSGLESRIDCRFVPTDQLDAVYAGARAFIFPSRKEGFGMPILESFAAGCPVILSDASCLPEVAGNAGVYFNPDSPEDIAEKIGKVIYDNNFRDTKIAEGRERLKSFSWEKCGRETAAVYNKTLGI